MPMLPLDIPPAIHERVVCSVSAAAKYDIPANVMLAVAFQEAGKPGQAVPNDNGTYDYGSMQINTAWLHELSKYGITAHDVSRAGCYSYDLAAWRIRHHIRHDRAGDMWQKVANYHSYTPEYNQEYRRLIMRRADYWANWLEKRFITVEINKRPSLPAPSSQNTSLASVPSRPVTPAPRRVAMSFQYVPRAITALN